MIKNIAQVLRIVRNRFVAEAASSTLAAIP